MNLVQLGAFFKSKRAEQRLTQSQVAAHLGISPQAVSKWERGENLPDVTFFPDLAALYHTTIDAIVNAGQIQSKPSEVGVSINQALVHKPLTPATLSELFDASLFEPVLELAQNSLTVAEMGISFEFFAYLSKTQKHALLDVLLAKPDYVLAIEDMIPTATATDRFRLLDKLLADQDFDTIQDIITFLGPRHRERLAQFIVAQQIPQQVIASLLPFFDHQQTQAIEACYLPKEAV